MQLAKVSLLTGISIGGLVRHRNSIIINVRYPNDLMHASPLFCPATRFHFVRPQACKGGWLQDYATALSRKTLSNMKPHGRGERKSKLCSKQHYVAVSAGSSLPTVVARPVGCILNDGKSDNTKRTREDKWHTFKHIPSRYP